MHHEQIIIGKKYQDGSRVLTAMFVGKEGVYFSVEPSCSTSSATEVFMNRHDREFWTRLQEYQEVVKKYVFAWKGMSTRQWISFGSSTKEDSVKNRDYFKSLGYSVTEVEEVVLRVLS